MNFKKTNNLIGWIVFIIGAITYFLTAEASVSWWDCGEFIATSYKMMVGHPPGAPIFQFIAKFFTLFAFGDTSKVAFTVNMMSGLSTAAAAMFLFWSLTIITNRIFTKVNGEHTLENKILIFTSSFIGAVSSIYCDTIWFSAVEGEVYALSMFLMAINFWGMLRWQEEYPNPQAKRWLYFTGFILGLTIGVHIVGLLLIPVFVFIFYFKRFGFSFKNFIIAGFLSLPALALVYPILYTGVFSYISTLEMALVNTAKMPFNSGLWVGLISLFLIFAFIIRYSINKNKEGLNTFIFVLFFIFIGHSSYTQVIIRAQSSITINENQPDSPFNLLSFLKREQYGSRPLLYGPQFHTKIVDIVKTGNYYGKLNNRYVPIAEKTDVVYDKSEQKFFPRMWSRKDSDINLYENWVGKLDREKGPTSKQNLLFYIKYQLGFMNLRYLLWNFAGRQSDVQGRGDITSGNWLSGIEFIDALRLGSRWNLPKSLDETPAHNKMYLLPFLLGLIGIFYILGKNKSDGVVILLFFFFVGAFVTTFAANSPPIEPRERDYSICGEIFVFCFWIGLGFIGVYETIKKYIKNYKIAMPIVFFLCILAGPVNMAAQNWNDHDRSKKYIPREISRSYLESCPPNAILFTAGDNDTFPLWYLQEVEGVRTDVRVIVQSYYNTDWYIDQTRRKTYESEPIRMSMPPLSYSGEKLQQVPVLTQDIGYIDLNRAMDYLNSNDQRTKRQIQSGEMISVFPSKKLKLAVDKVQVINTKTVSENDKDFIVSEMNFQLPSDYILKADLGILDVLAQNNWERPICFTSPPSSVGLDEYLQQEGFVFRVVPIRSSNKENYGFTGRINTDIQYDYLMNKVNIVGYNDSTIAIDYENIKLMLVLDLREKFSYLALKLHLEGKNDKALKVLDKCLEILPYNRVPIEHQMEPIIWVYYLIGQNEKARELAKQVLNDTKDKLDYYLGLEQKFIANGGMNEIRNNLVIQQNLLEKLNQNDTSLLSIYYPQFTESYKKFQALSGNPQ